MKDPYKVKMIRENISKFDEDKYHMAVLKGGSKAISINVTALKLLEAYYDDRILEQDLRRITSGL